MNEKQLYYLLDRDENKEENCNVSTHASSAAWKKNTVADKRTESKWIGSYTLIE